MSNSYSEEQKCLLCGKDVILKSTTQTGYKEPDLFHIWHCVNCNTAFSTPRVNTDDVYELIYQHAEDLHGYSEYLRIHKEIKSKKNPLRYLVADSLTYWSVAYSLKKLVKADKNMSIFEIGSGLGYLTYALHKEGYNAKGLDVSEEAVNKAKEYFGDFYLHEDLFSYAETHENSIDVIILTEVIEHVEDPLKFYAGISEVIEKRRTYYFNNT